MLTTGFWLLTSRKTARFCKWLDYGNTIPEKPSLLIFQMMCPIFSRLEAK
jgi:hypothetical protein